MSRIPPDAILVLLSNLDSGAPSLEGGIWILRKRRILLFETAKIPDGEAFSQGVPTPPVLQGADVRLCDLRRETAATLERRLASADVCLIAGGNTFFLLAHAGPLDGVLRRRAEAGPLTVVGESAGALIFRTRIGHIAPMDDPGAAPDMPADAPGLGWIPWRVLPHLGSQDRFGPIASAILAQDPAPDTLLPIAEGEVRIFRGPESGRQSGRAPWRPAP